MKGVYRYGDLLKEVIHTNKENTQDENCEKVIDSAIANLEQISANKILDEATIKNLSGIKKYNEIYEKLNNNFLVYATEYGYIKFGNDKVGYIDSVLPNVLWDAVQSNALSNECINKIIVPA